VKFRTARRSPVWRSFLALTLIVSGAGIVAACGSSTSQPSCTGDTQAYNGNCLTTAAITYIDCTKGQGFDVSSEIGGGIGGTFRAVVGASLNLAVKKTQQDHTAVALQIVHDCLVLAQQRPQAAADRAATQDYVQQTNQAIRDYQQSQVAETPHITLDKSSAAIGEAVTVSGTSFWPNETIDIWVHATLVKQVQADNNGAFTTEITVPASVPPPDFQTAISATGETSAKSAEAPFRSAG